MPSTAALALSAVQAIQASQSKAQAMEASAKAASQFAAIREVNKLASLKVPTLGTDLAKQNLEQRTANELNILQQSNNPALLLGGLTAVNQQAQEQDLNLAAKANEMEYNRNAMVAQQDQAIEAGRVNREAGLAQSRIAGAGQARAEAEQNLNSALGGAVQIMGANSLLDSYQQAYQDPNAPRDIPSFMQGKTGNFWDFLGGIGFGKKNV